jgi:hypothetical protein
MKKITLALEAGKTVELSQFYVSGCNTVSMAVRLVEVDVQFQYCFDFGGFSQWRKDNPGMGWRDYVKPTFLTIFDSYALAVQVQKQLNSEATE